VEVVALASRGDECALHEELVFAFDGERRVLLHGLEQHWESASDEAQDVQKKKKNVYLVLLRSLRVLSYPSLDGRSIAVG